MMWYMRGKIAIGWGNWGRLCEGDFNLTDGCLFGTKDRVNAWIQRISQLC